MNIIVTVIGIRVSVTKNVAKISVVFDSHWWRYVDKCGKLSQLSWLLGALK